MLRPTLILLSLFLGACHAPRSKVELWRAELARTGTPEARAARFEADRAAGLGHGTGARDTTVRTTPNWTQRRVVVTSSGGSGLYMFDVSDLTRGVRDFAAPTIGDLRPSSERPEAETRYGDEFGTPVPLIESDVLVDLIRSGVLPGTWDDDDVSISIKNGILIVRHP